jgi:hypothetical protein
MLRAATMLPLAWITVLMLHIQVGLSLYVIMNWHYEN